MVEKSDTVNFNTRVPRALAEEVDQLIERNLYKNRSDCVIDSLRQVVRTARIAE